MIDPLRKLEIKQYAEAVIFAFEFKKPIRSFCFKGKNEVRFFAQCIDDIIVLIPFEQGDVFRLHNFLKVYSTSFVLIPFEQGDVFRLKSY